MVKMPGPRSGSTNPTSRSGDKGQSVSNNSSTTRSSNSAQKITTEQEKQDERRRPERKKRQVERQNAKYNQEIPKTQSNPNAKVNNDPKRAASDEEKAWQKWLQAECGSRASMS